MLRGENAGQLKFLDVLEGELYKQQTCSKYHDPFSCFQSDCDINSGLQYLPGSHLVDQPCSTDVPFLLFTCI